MTFSVCVHFFGTCIYETNNHNCRFARFLGVVSIGGFRSSNDLKTAIKSLYSFPGQIFFFPYVRIFLLGILLNLD